MNVGCHDHGRIVDNAVKPTKCVERCVDQALWCSVVGNVFEIKYSVVVAQFGNQFFAQVLLVKPVNNYATTFGYAAFGNGPANTSTATCDDNDFVL